MALQDMSLAKLRKLCQYEIQEVGLDGEILVSFEEAGEVFDEIISRIQSIAWLEGYEAARLSDRIGPVNPYRKDGELW